MEVRCERCKAQYQVDEAAIPPVGLALQCTQCGHVFLVKKKELVVTVPVKPGTLTGAPVPASTAGRLTQAGGVPVAPAAAPEDPASEWRVRLVTGEIFPCRDLQTLQKWVVERRVGRDDEVAPPGHSYKKLRELAELDTFFEVVEAADRAAAAPPAAPPPAAPPPRKTVTRATAVSTPAAPPPSLDVDLEHGDPDLDAIERAAVGGGHGLRNALLVIGALVVIAAGAWVLAPGLFAPVIALFQPPPPAPAEAPPAAPPAVAAEPAPPAADAAKPAEPTPAPVPAPAEPAPQAAPAAEAPPPAAPAPTPAAAPAPKGPKALVAQAERLRMKGDLQRALDLYDRAAEADPDNADALAGRGLCYLDLEQYESASTAFRETLRVDPEHPDALLGAAEAARSLGRTADAIKHYQRYLELHPDGDEAPVARNALEELRR